MKYEFEWVVVKGFKTQRQLRLSRGPCSLTMRGSLRVRTGDIAAEGGLPWPSNPAAAAMRVVMVPCCMQIWKEPINPERADPEA